MQLLRCFRGPLKIHEENFVSDKAREEPLTFVSDKARRLKYLKGNIYTWGPKFWQLLCSRDMWTWRWTGVSSSVLWGLPTSRVSPAMWGGGTPAFTWDRQTTGLGSTPLLSHCCFPMSYLFQWVLAREDRWFKAIFARLEKLHQQRVVYCPLSLEQVNTHTSGSHGPLTANDTEQLWMNTSSPMNQSSAL